MPDLKSEITWSDSSTTESPPCAPPLIDPVAQFQLDVGITGSREPFDTISQFVSRDARRQRRQAKFFPLIKACTCVDAERFLRDKSLGITWVALHGIDSICVVTKNNDLVHLEQELSRPGCTHTTGTFLRYFWNAIVSEVEGIEGHMFGRSRKRPFSVVSVISGTSKASRAEYRAKYTSKFLQEEMKSGATFTFDKTIQTAISAFQHLFRREFEADEIRVFAWKKDDIVGKELRQMNPGLEELLASIDEAENDLDTV